MPVSVKTRFEVFKRDRFTCSYCGRTPPTVLLELDHVVPRAAGGTDDIENLTTSCWDCNRGKRDGLLQEGTAPVVSREVVEELEERLAQAEAYAQLMQRSRALEDSMMQSYRDAWADAFGATIKEFDDGAHYVLTQSYEEWPRDVSVRTILRRLPLHEVIEAIQIAADWSHGYSGERTCRYFYGVCWKRIRERDGRDG